MFRNPNSRTLLTHTVIIFSAIILLCVLSIVIYQGNKSHKNDLKNGYENAERLVNTFADHIELNFLAVDLTLRRAVERQYFNFLFGNNLRQDMEHNFNVWLEETPQLAALFIVNEKGVIELLSQKPSYLLDIEEGSSLKQNNLFKTLKNNDNPETVIHRMNDDSNLILMGKRINKLDSGFGGIIFAVIDGDDIAKFFRSIETQKKTSLMLLLEQTPLLAVTGNTSGHPIPDISHFMTSSGITKLSTSETIVLEETFGKILHIFAFKRLANTPILLGIATHEDDIFVISRSHRVNYTALLFIFTIFAVSISLFTLLMSRQINQVQESERAAILASQAKSDFLAKMSHELRTPLNAIIGFSQMMDSGYFGNLNDKQKERIHDINICGSHLLELINDILEFSKGEGGKLVLIEDDIIFSQIVGKVLRIIHQRAKTTDVKIIDKTSEDLPLLRADERKLRQILLNLISNAIKFTPRGGSITISADINNHNQFVFSVADTGIGIPAEEIPKALSIFGQVHSHLNSEGTGLGLPLCKMFAELHGGELLLESHVNQGTTVSVTLPSYRAII